MRHHALSGLLLVVLLATVPSSACGRERDAAAGGGDAAPAPTAKLAKATFAGGCFWCMEGPFDELPGVVSTTSGYTGGQKKNPTYEEVSSGGTGHAEAVQVLYDPAKVSYDKLLQVFWRSVDPLARDYQFCDHGEQYRSAIFVHDATQRRLAEASQRALEKQARFRGKIATEIVPATTFYPAEEYHQDYYRKNPVRYKLYRTGCGRDRRLAELWGEAGH
jgi:peptide-methionine (S)-S-oxide reductase